MKIQRQQLVDLLESVKPGLSRKELLEQSSCFVFRPNSVVTFNDEIACRAPCKFGFEGAVSGNALIKALPRLSTDSLDFDLNGESLTIKAKRQKIVLALIEPRLPIKEVEKPGDWRELPENFNEALESSFSCAGKNRNEFVLTCVHLLPSAVETCDRKQLIRYHIDLPIDVELLVRAEAVKSILDKPLRAISVSEHWVHFKSTGGLQISIRQYAGTYPKLDQFMEVTGDEVVFPDDLAKGVRNAQLFCAENQLEDQVEVKLQAGLLVLRSEGIGSKYLERFRTSYQGPDLQFKVHPKLLLKILQRSSQCVVDQQRGMIKVQDDSYSFVSCIGK